MRRPIPLFIGIVEAILIVVHAFVYETWTTLHHMHSSPGIWKLRTVAALLSVSFIAASLLGWRSHHFLVRVFYTLAAVWLGVLNFLFLASFASWLVYAIVWVAGLQVTPPQIVDALFGLALLVSLCATVNASWTRVHRITVKLRNLPESWRGRVAAHVSDTHLGHIRNVRFLRRIVRMLQRLKPDVVFITGDMFDGTALDVNGAAKPWAELSPPLGTYFITGNHEEFTGHMKYVKALQSTGVRVLDGEKVDVEGLQIVGVHYVDSVNPAHFRSILQRACLDRNRASILLLHAPDRMAIAAEEGISLQLSGHTHGGQMPPFSWITSRVYGKYVHGLQRFGEMLIFTTWGAGTWGPPMRLGTQSEIVLIHFA